jgi:lysophospholipase L1-like esterase
MKLKITAAVILSVVLLELTLRLMGGVYLFLHRTPQISGPGYKIFCIGESTTWGTGAAAPLLQGYPKQLEGMLNERYPKLGIQCFFDDSIGQNTSEILYKLPGYVSKYNPRLVIIMAGVNNWWNLDRSNILLFRKDTVIPKATLRLLIFLDRFRVWKLLKWAYYRVCPPVQRYNLSLAVARHSLYEMQKNIFFAIDAEIFAMVADYDIRSMIDICRAHKVHVIIASYPRVGGNLYAAQKKIAEDLSLPFVDNLLFFDQLPDSNEYFSPDNWHPNEKGYFLLAQNICQVIAANNLIP